MVNLDNLYLKALEKWNICKTVVQEVVAYYLSQYLVEVHHNYYIIHYPFGMKWYKIIVQRVRGPQSVDSVYSHDGTDITDSIAEYFGPCYNAHQTAITPKLLGHTAIKIVDYSGNEKIFNENDIISC